MRQLFSTLLLLLLLCSPFLVISQKKDSWDYQREGKYEKAMELAFKEMVDAKKMHLLPTSDPKHLHDTVYVEVLENASTIFYLSGRMNDALPPKEEAFGIRLKYYREKPGATIRRVEFQATLHALALIYFYTGNYERVALSAKAISDAGHFYSTSYTDTEYADYYPANDVATLYQFVGNYHEAEKIYQSAVDYYHQKLLASNAKFNNTLKALANLQEYHTLERYYYAVTELATFYQNTGLFNKEEPLLKQFEEISRKKFGEDNRNYGLWLTTMGPFYGFMGRYDYAKELIERARKNFDEKAKKDNAHYSTILNNLASINILQEDYVEAEKNVTQAWETAQRNKGKVTDATLQFIIIPTNLAFVYYKRGRLNEALRIQRTAIHEYVKSRPMQGENIRHHGWYQTMGINLGLIHQGLKQYDSAEYYFKNALLFNNVRIQQRALTARNLAQLYEEMKRPEDAHAMYEVALKIYNTSFNANLYHFSEKERSDLFRELSKTLNLINAFAIKNSQQHPEYIQEMYDNQLGVKAILFSSSKNVRENIMQSGNQDLIRIYNSWQYKKDYLSKVYQLNDQQRKDQKIDLPVLEAEANAMEKELSSKSQLFAKTQKNAVATWRDVQKKLLVGDAAIEIVRIPVDAGSNRISYAALILKAGTKAPELILLDNGHELEKKFANYYHNAIAGGLEDNITYDQFWKRINEKLAGIKRVYFAPDGVYNMINVNTLMNPATKKFLVDEISIQLVANTKDLLETSTNEIPKKAFLFGYPDYKSKTSPVDTATMIDQIPVDSVRSFFAGRITELPGTKKEVQSIESILKSKQVQVTSLIGSNATEEQFKKVNSPSVLHIATHGFFLGDDVLATESSFMGFGKKELTANPLLRAGLLFAGSQQTLDGAPISGEDGVLTAFEAMTLPLQNTQLVVLSACETGRGKIRNGEGVYGLQRSFQAAGAKSVLMSLWKVDDTATQELMSIFYGNWLKTGNKREAFLSAQKAIKLKYPQPKFWGAFVMVN